MLLTVKWRTILVSSILTMGHLLFSRFVSVGNTCLLWCIKCCGEEQHHRSLDLRNCLQSSITRWREICPYEDLEQTDPVAHIKCIVEAYCRSALYNGCCPSRLLTIPSERSDIWGLAKRDWDEVKERKEVPTFKWLIKGSRRCVSNNSVSPR